MHSSLRWVALSVFVSQIFVPILAEDKVATTASPNATVITLPAEANITYTNKVQDKLFDKKQKGLIEAADTLNISIDKGKINSLEVLSEGYIDVAAFATPKKDTLLIQVTGLDIDQAKSKIAKALSKSELQISLVKAKAKTPLKATIYGAVFSKGIYDDVTANSTIGDFLLKKSGGFLVGADLKRVEVHRKDGTTFPLWLSQFSEYENDSFNNKERIENIINSPNKKAFIELFRDESLVRDDLNELRKNIKSCLEFVNKEIDKAKEDKAKNEKYITSSTTDTLKKDETYELKSKLEASEIFINQFLSPDEIKLKEPLSIATNSEAEFKASINGLLKGLQTYFPTQVLMSKKNFSFEHRNAKLSNSDILVQYYPLLRAISLTVSGVNLNRPLLDGDIVEIPSIRAMELAKRNNFEPTNYLYNSAPLLPLRDYSLFNTGTPVTIVGETATEDKRVDNFEITSGGQEIGINTAKGQLSDEQKIKTAQILNKTQANITRRTNMDQIIVPVGTDVMGSIELAGGYTLQASRNKVYLFRVDPTDFQTKNLGLVKINQNSSSYKLSCSTSPGDIIVVRPILFMRNPIWRYTVGSITHVFDAAAQLGNLAITAMILRK